MVVGENQPAEFAWKGVGQNGGHVIVFEGNHLERATLCQWLWESGEFAIRKEGDFQFVETAEIIGE